MRCTSSGALRSSSTNVAVLLGFFRDDDRIHGRCCARNKVFLGRTVDADAMEGTIPPGATGEVIEDIVPPAAGKIRYGGSFWLATAEKPLSRGTVVRIVEKSNLTLKVGPVTTEGEE